MGQKSNSQYQAAKNRERISDAELAIMEVLWEQSPLTATEVSGRVAVAARLVAGDGQDAVVAARSQKSDRASSRRAPLSLCAARSNARPMSPANRGGWSIAFSGAN